MAREVWRSVAVKTFLTFFALDRKMRSRRVGETEVSGNFRGSEIGCMLVRSILGVVAILR